MYSNSTADRIKVNAMKELVGDDDTALGDLWNRVFEIFQRWKKEHGNRKPIAPVGMFSDVLGQPIPFKTAAPWQCADFTTPSPVALAVKLMREAYRPLWAIMEQEGTRKVLALLVVGFADQTSEGDLFAANDILVRHKTAEAAMQEHRVAIIAHRGRPVGGKSRGEQQKTEKAEKHAHIRDAEAELAPTTKPRNLNKAIAKKTGFETDYVRKARKEIKQETDNS